MRALTLASLLAVGCYDVGGLTRGYSNNGSSNNNSDGGAGDGATAASKWQPVAPPAKVALRGVFGSDSGDVFAVGASSAIMRLATAAQPLVEPAPPGYGLRAVWAGSGAAVAVGDSESVLTRGNSGWAAASLADATLYGVIGLPGGGELAVGSSGAILHNSGSGWNGEDPGAAVTGLIALRGVSARALGDIVVVGEGGTILRGTGTTPLNWSTDTKGANPDLFAVWADSNDAWAVGAGGTILHSAAGGSWSAEHNDSGADLFGVFAAGGSVWAVGAGGTILIRRGGAWSGEHSGGADLRAVWTASNGEGWAVGDDGTILHRTP
jgi:hypothetical protein